MIENSNNQEIENKYMRYFKLSILFMILMFILLKLNLFNKAPFILNNLFNFIGIISIFIPPLIISIANKKLPKNKKIKNILIFYIIFLIILLIIGQTSWIKSLIDFIKSIFKSLE